MISEFYPKRSTRATFLTPRTTFRALPYPLPRLWPGNWFSTGRWCMYRPWLIRAYRFHNHRTPAWVYRQLSRLPLSFPTLLNFQDQVILF